MRDLHDQADRAGAPAPTPTPEREWTDRAALARAVAASRSREEAIRIVAAWDLPPLSRPLPSPADIEMAQRSRAVSLACVQAPERKRPDTRGLGPLFARRGGTP